MKTEDGYITDIKANRTTCLIHQRTTPVGRACPECWAESSTGAHGERKLKRDAFALFVANCDILSQEADDDSA